MSESRPTMAQEIAEAVTVFQHQTTGHAPRSVTAVLSQDTLVVTLHEALSPAERYLAKTPSGGGQVREFHRQLFSSSSRRLQNDIKRIAGVEVCEAVEEIESSTDPIVQALTGSAMVQVCRLAKSVPDDSWSGSVVEKPLTEERGSL